MALPKWTDERTEELTSFVGTESPVSQETVAEAADRLETSTRSVSSSWIDFPVNSCRGSCRKTCNALAGSLHCMVGARHDQQNRVDAGHKRQCISRLPQ